MAKGQKKTNREAKKPKAVRAPAVQAVTVTTLMSKGALAPARRNRVNETRAMPGLPGQAPVFQASPATAGASDLLAPEFRRHPRPTT